MLEVTLNPVLLLGGLQAFLAYPTARRTPLRISDPRRAGIIEGISQYLGALSALGLTVTLDVAKERLRELQEELKKYPKANNVVTDSDAKRLARIMADVEAACKSEAKRKPIFMPTDGRMTVRQLLGGADSLLQDDVRTQLPDIALYDVSEAGKCIAFERPTAAAFHILRATEAVVRCYYLMVVKRERLKEKQRTMGGMLAQLRARRKRSDKLLGSLQNIADHYRNPTMHPEERYDLDRAYDLFLLCVSAIGLTVRDEFWQRSTD